MRWVVIGAAAVLASGAAAALFARSFVPGPAPAVPIHAAAGPTSPAAVAAAPVEPAAVSTAAPASAGPRLPSVFAGTDVDGGVTVDEDGRIVPTRALRALFDYYLSGIGEYPGAGPIAAIKARLHAYAHRKALAQSATKQLLALFGQYIAYRKAAAAYAKANGTTDMAQALCALSQLRIAYLGSEMAAAFYGEQTRLTRAALARRQGKAGAESLTPTQRRAMAPMRLAHRVQTLRKNGASDAAIAAARQQAVGPAAAQRLQALDDRRNAWQKTYNAYRAERATVMASGLARSDRQKALRALRKRYFSKQAIRRVQALDRLAAQRANPPSR